MEKVEFDWLSDCRYFGIYGGGCRCFRFVGMYNILFFGRCLGCCNFRIIPRDLLSVKIILFLSSVYELDRNFYVKNNSKARFLIAIARPTKRNQPRSLYHLPEMAIFAYFTDTRDPYISSPILLPPNP